MSEALPEFPREGVMFCPKCGGELYIMEYQRAIPRSWWHLNERPERMLWSCGGGWKGCGFYTYTQPKGG